MATPDRLWPWYLVTVLYLTFIGLIIFDRWSEIGPLFEALKAGETRLSLHNIGDLLAGIFALLAFLWLFIATQLQRRELRLQRRELTDTRAVLDEQRRELERAAKESNAQTKIMQDTLESSMISDRYNYFSLSLYYYCRSVAAGGIKYLGYSVQNNSENLATKGWSNYSFQISPDTREISLSPVDSASVDDFIQLFHSQIDSTFGDVYDADNIRVGSIKRNADAIDFLRRSFRDLEALHKEGLQMNSDLIRLRINSLRIPSLIQSISRLESTIIRRAHDE